MAKFKLVSSQIDFPALERDLLDYWYKEGIVGKYLKRNEKSEKKFSFLDGPITANNPMGVHHGWGRTYKDLWQRFFNMKGFRQRFQNGFDEQGLWVEVEVEKELGLKSKKEIENLIPGDKFKSLEKFINLCKDRVKKYSAIQTEQSKSLGYFMDWDNSYHTSSDENNYAIWNYLKVVHEKGWLYKGRDSVPWCPRCGTAISQHEILTEEYQELTHKAVFVKYKLLNSDENLLVWTTTPWTLPSNVAIAADPDLRYQVWQNTKTKEKVIFARGDLVKDSSSTRDIAQEILTGSMFGGEWKDIKDYKGSDLVGRAYKGLFDELPAVRSALGMKGHRIVVADPKILPINVEEGTGLVHIAPGAGNEDFQLSKKEQLPVIASINEEAFYLDGFGWLQGLTTKEAPPKIIEELDKKGYLFKVEDYKHRYPTCWRCKTELVWRVVDEWYIAMDKKDKSGKTYREQMMGVAKKIHWMPSWGLDRELDWLKNMRDWLISKKRYWGLTLPIWECQSCGNFELISSKEELKEKTVEGWKDFEGHSPHRPWVDQVKIKCSKCNKVISRIPDVGNPWLDAGIVPFSTMPEDWFPADFVTEGFPGQFKNWFYSLIAMSTALKNENPFKNLLGFANVVDEKGEEMHKSKGNAIEFNEAADKIGVDVMRWLYTTQNPEYNLLFGYHVADEIRRRFYLILWNCYKFFVDYALLANWDCNIKTENLTILDKWILARLTEVVLHVINKLSKYDAATSSRAIEDFIVNDFSTWYIRRSRDRVGPETSDDEKSIALSVMFGVLVTISKLLAPFMPFVSEEIYKNLTGDVSVHLQDYPQGDEALLNERLVKDMQIARKIAELGHAKRKEAQIKLRQPLAKLTYKSVVRLENQLEQLLSDELNVKLVEYEKSSKSEPEVALDTNITPKLKEEGEARELIRMIQQARKELNMTLADKTKIIAPRWPKSFEGLILTSTVSITIEEGKDFKVLKIDENSIKN